MKSQLLEPMRVCQQDDNGDSIYDGDEALRLISKIASCNGTTCEIVWEELREGSMVKTCAAQYYAPDFVRG